MNGEIAVKSSTIAGGSGKEARRAFDFYATPAEATIAVLDFLQLGKELNFTEPACGNGAISKVLDAYGYAVRSFDIRHDSGFGEGGIDYFKEKVPCDVIITNPPFSLAEQFIKKALNEAPIVIMLLKAHYWHARKRTTLFQSHTPKYVLPLTWRPNWIEGESTSSPTMDFQWTVWMPGTEKCQYSLLIKPNVQLLTAVKSVG